MGSETNDFRGVGGRYEVRENGEVVQVEPPTRDHPDGNKGPRDAEGKLIETPQAAAAAAPAADAGPATTRFARGRAAAPAGDSATPKGE